MTRILTVVTAGLRTPSSTRLLADRLADAARTALAGDGTVVEVRVVEVREYAHEIADALLSGFPGERLRGALDDVVAADALVVVTPTFQASYSGLFKSFIDLIEADTLRGMPVLLAATGGSERHSLVIEHALRPLFAYLRAVPTPTGVYAATSDFGSAAGDALDGRIERAAAELADLASGGAHRAPRRDEFADVTPFERLLARSGR